MSSQIRELFESAAESEPPDDLASCAVAGARLRRRQRYTVAGSVLAAVAIVLGFVVVNSSQRLADAPRPDEVAGLPQELPAPENVANLEPGMVDAASAAYLVDAFLVVVDGSTGTAARVAFGPPLERGVVGMVAITPTDVVLSPDGRQALVTVSGWAGNPPTLRVVDLATARETVIPDLVPSSDDSTLTNPSVAAWSNDSGSLTCVCAAKAGNAPSVVDVVIDEQDPTKLTVQPSVIAPNIAAGQVVIGTAGLAIQLDFPRSGGGGALSNPDGSWMLPDGSTEGGPSLPDADLVALGRGPGSRTYLAERGGGITLGKVGSDSFDPATVTAVVSLTYSNKTGGLTVVTDVDAVGGGFLLVTQNALSSRRDAAPSVERPQVVSIAEDGTQRLLSTLPPSATAASFAADLLRAAPEPTPEPDQAAPLPDQLPAPSGLPRLTADTMAFASAAYVVDGRLVVIDSTTGDGATVPLSCARGYVCSVVPGIGADTSLALSPNGRFLLVSSGKTDLEPGGVEWLWLVDVATGVATPQSFKLAPASVGSAVPQTPMAWSPAGQSFACICSGPGRAQLLTANVSEVEADLVVNSLSGPGIAPKQISWGSDGLAAQLPELDGDWRLVPPGDASRANPEKWPTISSVLNPRATELVNAVVMAQSRQGGFLGLIKGGDYWLVTDRIQTVESVSVNPVLGALGNSYFTVFTDWKGDPISLEVQRLNGDGETTLTTLPHGATTVSFASALVS